MRTTTFATVQQGFEKTVCFRETLFKRPLSTTTIFPCTVGWSGFTVSRSLKPRCQGDQLYIYHVRPIFEYASPLWHGAISAELALSLEFSKSCSVARAILRAPWQTPKQQLLKALNWPSLRWRRAIASTCLFQQLIHAPNTLPSLSKHLFPLLSSRSTRNRRKPFQIAFPKVRTTRYQHSFFFHTALLWNGLPQSIQATKPPQQFRIALEQLWHKYKHNPTTDIPLPFRMEVSRQRGQDSVDGVYKTPFLLRLCYQSQWQHPEEGENAKTSRPGILTSGPAVDSPCQPGALQSGPTPAHLETTSLYSL